MKRKNPGIKFKNKNMKNKIIHPIGKKRKNPIQSGLHRNTEKKRKQRHPQRYTPKALKAFVLYTFTHRKTNKQI
jgi:hypothetical protein